MSVRGTARVDTPGDQADANQRTGLGAMDGLHQLWGWLMLLGFQVHDLAADHAINRSCSLRDGAHNLYRLRSRALQAGEHFVGLGLQRIPGKDGNRFAKDHVAGRLAPAQIIVVQRGQIIMDQGIGVQHFDRRAQLFHPGRKLTGARDHSCRLHAQHRTQPLAPGKNAVPHRAGESRPALDPHRAADDPERDR